MMLLQEAWDHPRMTACMWDLSLISIRNTVLRFRLRRCAFVADIEKAFLMIAVAEQDRDACG